MAAERAVTMQMRTSTNWRISELMNCEGKTTLFDPGTIDVCNTQIPSTNPINAKGIAKMVWENFIKER